MWFFKKKRAEHALQELLDGLARTLGPKLRSVLLYGSKASGEYLEGRSDLNVFVLLDDVSLETLNRMAEPLKGWRRAGHPVPVFLPEKELSIYAKCLPVEFLDMRDHHKVIHGSDPFERLTIDRTYLRAQCLQELAVKQLRIRQAALLAEGNAKKLRDVLLDSLPSILTLYRAALRLEMDVPKGNKITAARELSRRVDFDGECLERLSNNHIRRAADNLPDVAHHYLDGIERVLTYLSQK